MPDTNWFKTGIYKHRQICIDMNRYFGMYKDMNGWSENSFGKEKKLTNEDIRKSVFMNRLTYKSIAAKIGITPETITRWMRQEMTDWQKELLANTIADMVTEKKGESK